MTMMLLLEGRALAELGISMMIFKNNGCSNPGSGTTNTVPGVFYRTGPKGWMDRSVFA